MIQLQVAIDPPRSGVGYFPQGITYFPQTVYTCPECKTTASFYSISPKCCKKCKKTIPDLRILKGNLEARIQYYFNE